MLKRILLTLVLISVPLPVIADGFTSSGDLTENRYQDTLGFGIGGLPQKGICPNCVQYSDSDLVGTNTSYILGNVSISNVTSLDPSYGLIRDPNTYATLSLPPYSYADFIYWYRNNTGHDVNISLLRIYLSRYYTYQGDLRNILNIDGTYESNTLQTFGWIYPRNGIVRTYDGLGNVNSNSSGVLRLESVVVKSPLTFENWEAQIDGGVVHMKISVRNITEILERNIVFNHGEYTLKKDFEPNEVFEYIYDIPFEDTGSFGFASIYNPNSRKECTTFGESLESNYVGDSAPMSGVRGEGFNYIGSRVKPWGEAFCITRIPSTIFSSEMIYEREVKDEVVEVVDEDPEVLGISKLPQTNYCDMCVSLFVFLVVVLILWYYFLRKKRI